MKFSQAIFAGIFSLSSNFYAANAYDVAKFELFADHGCGTAVESVIVDASEIGAVVTDLTSGSGRLTWIDDGCWVEMCWAGSNCDVGNQLVAGDCSVAADNNGQKVWDKGRVICN